MTDTRFLTDEEVEQLTGYRLAKYQRRELLLLRIRFFVRPKDGKPVVLHSDIAATNPKKREPQWENLA